GRCQAPRASAWCRGTAHRTAHRTVRHYAYALSPLHCVECSVLTRLRTAVGANRRGHRHGAEELRTALHTALSVTMPMPSGLCTVWSAPCSPVFGSRSVPSAEGIGMVPRNCAPHCTPHCQALCLCTQPSALCGVLRVDQTSHVRIVRSIQPFRFRA